MESTQYDSDYSTAQTANTGASAYSIASGLANLISSGGGGGSGGSSSGSGGGSSSGNGGSSSGNGGSGRTVAQTAQSATISQIAQDLLHLNRSNGANNNNNNTNNSSSYTASQQESRSISISGAVSGALSSIETAILRSTVPIDINETEEITVHGQRGIWANRAEVVNWRGLLPINQYVINEDSNPEVITKRSQQQLVYQQEVAIRYLRPPTPPAPGEILIQQEVNTLTPPAPPLVIRQQPPRPTTPQPLVVREAPPQPPAAVGRKVITISGKRIPPPPRKVVIERLAPLPSKPQSVIIERWLPYSQVKRRVIFQRAQERDAVLVKPRNVIIQWEAPQVKVNKDFKDLGVIRANPAEYVARYGSTLKTAKELPSFVLEIKPPAGVVLAADNQYSSVYELEGDVQALRLIDLDREGLSEYRSLVQRLGPAIEGAGINTTSSLIYNDVKQLTAGNAAVAISSNASSSQSATAAAVAEIFSTIDRDNNGRVTIEEAEKILLRLNSRLGRRYGEDDVRAFFNSLDTNMDGFIDLEEFRRAFENQI